MTATKDRTYYRQMPDEYLIEQGKESNHELCIALAERLQDAAALDERVVDQQETIDELHIEISDLTNQVADLESEISALVAQINEGQPK